MKILELRIHFVQDMNAEDLAVLGEHFQQTLPIDIEEISDVTFEILENTV